ncbi:uncharacterized protein [Nicotiana tomentosiformis]|uniref:uncharacterized protein n=1 Tax=Nicotiana tomentosiformis TaxID=4098 RepID=UPI00388CB9AA
MALQYQAPAAPPVGVIQPVVAVQADNRSAMSFEALLRLDNFTKLFPVHFSDEGSSKRWWRDFTLTRRAGSPTLTWEQFSKLFLEKFLPITLREDYRRQFERLQQGSMTVTQYESRFMDLAYHAFLLLPTGGERVRRFIEGLTHPIRLQMDKEAGSEISFQVDANVARRIEMSRGE